MRRQEVPHTHIHTYTHIYTHPCILSSLLQNILTHTHTLTFGHTALRPTVDLYPIQTQLQRLKLAVTVTFSFWSGMFEELPLQFFFFAVRREFTERDGGQVLVYFQETFKATSELVATYNKCQDRKQRDFSNSELQRVP